MGRLSGTSSGGRLSSGSSGGRLKSASQDLGTVEGLTNYANTVGLGKEAQAIANPVPKMSVLQRLDKALGAFNPAEAILTGKEKGALKGIWEYPKRVVGGVASAISGADYLGEQRKFKDLVKDEGIDNKIAQYGIGFAGDVLLDPSTYFGGTLVKGVLKYGGKAGTLALKGVGKVAPEVETGLKLAGKGAKDALGRAFKFGYGSSKGASTDVLTFLSKKQQAELGLAASNLNRLGTGTLTASQQEELALKLIAGKRAEFTARQAGEAIPDVARSADPTVQASIEAQKARTTSFASKLDIENPYETYFPFIKKDKLDGFIQNVGSANIKVGSQTYLKEFKNLLTNEAMELNPAKAFFTSEAQQVTDRMSRDFLSGFVKKYGKSLDEFTSLDDARKAGYDVIKEKGMFGKELGYINKYDSSLIKDAISPEFQTINMLAKATGFDAVTSLFKRSVTGLFLPFHVRNFVSGQIQNFEALGVAALNPKNINLGQKIAYLMATGKEMPAKLINVGGKQMKFRDVMKPFVNRFSGDTAYGADFETAFKGGSQFKTAAKLFSKERIKDTLLPKVKGTTIPLGNILGSESPLFKSARAVGQFIEHGQKATAYVTALSQGNTVRQSLALAEKAGFDYRALTRFESQILRRLVPFYSFTRKNIGLQLSTLGENPQRINQVLAFFNNMGESLSEEEKKVLPSFLQDSLGVKLQDTPEGLKQYISSFGTPIEAFAQLFGSNPVLRAISQTNPILKAPIEIGIGKDSFRQKDLKDVYNANEYKLAPQVIKDLLNIKEVDKPILKKNASGKLVQVGTRKQYVADPERLLIARSLFTSRGVSYLDQVFGGDMKGFVKAIKVTTGVKPIQQDLELNAAMQNTAKRRELEDLLTKKGGLSNYSTVYKPKQ